MMLLLLLVFLTLLASFCSCQFQGMVMMVAVVSNASQLTFHRPELYLQCTGKLTGLQELGRAWSLIVGTENFAPIYDLTRDLNYSISEESLRGGADVTQSKNSKEQKWPNSSILDIAQLLCNAHGILHEMIAQFEPTEPVNEGKSWKEKKLSSLVYTHFAI